MAPFLKCALGFDRTGSDWLKCVSLGRERHLCCALTGPVCGKLEATLKNMTLKSNEVTISFTSGPHRSGRGFLLSYSSDQYPGSVS